MRLFGVATYMVKSMHFQKKNTVFDLGSRSHKMLPSTPYIMSPLHMQSLKLLRPTAWEEMHSQENTLFDHDLGARSYKM